MAARLKLAHRQGLFPLGLPSASPTLGTPNMTTNIPSHLQTFLYQQQHHVNNNSTLQPSPSQLLNALSVSNSAEITNLGGFR